jgi:hypothetical protein
MATINAKEQFAATRADAAGALMTVGLDQATSTIPWRRRALARLDMLRMWTQTAAAVVEALLALALFDIIAMTGFKHTHSITRRIRTRRRAARPDAVQRTCSAVDEACVWYYKRIFCLQRSAVATWMLRRRGIHAELVIGYRPIPVDSHAWVEVDGAVVNDRPQYKTFFKVLERL